MEAKYIERLEQVVRVLEELPSEKKFNLARWMKCGTVGCAIGWTASDPWFIRRGFKLRKDGPGSKYYTPCYKINEDFCAVMCFFGIDRNQSHDLFIRSTYGTDGSKRAVIRRLKGFIKEQREAA